MRLVLSFALDYSLRLSFRTLKILVGFRVPGRSYVGWSGRIRPDYRVSRP